MQKVQIVTDSTSDIPEDLVKKLGIIVVPLKVIFKEKETLRDGIDITIPEFYNRLPKEEIIPQTSQPTPEEFATTYKKLITQTECKNIISIHISSNMSGTIQSAQLGKKLLLTEGIAPEITIIDSNSVSMGCGLIVLEAAKAAQEGKTQEEILDLIQKMIAKMIVLFMPSTLEYLKKGGRIGRSQALLGTILNILPICHIAEGTVYLYEKARGHKRALKRLVEITSEKLEGKEAICAIPHGMDIENAQKIRSMVLEKIPVKAEPIIYTPGSIVGTHSGPGVLGLICCPL